MLPQQAIKTYEFICFSRRFPSTAMAVPRGSEVEFAFRDLHARRGLHARMILR